MGTNSSEFEKKLLATFQCEAQVHLDAIASGLIELEKPINVEQHDALVEATFRETHTLKGAARSVDLPDIEETCQALENVFSASKRREIVLSREIFNILHDSVAVIETLLSAKKPETRDALKKSRDLIPVLEKISQGIMVLPVETERADHESDQETPPDPVSERQIFASSIPDIQANTVRIFIDQLNSLMLQAEELGDGKRAAAQRSEELEIICREFSSWKRRWGRIRTRLMALRRSSQPTILQKPDVYEKSEILKFAEFLDYNAEFVLNLESKLVREKNKARVDHQVLLEQTDTHINDIRGLLMMPAGSILEIFPRFVREFAQDKEKFIDLDISGSDIVIDRRILEEMKDAFIHLIRNAIDHGIEKPDIRTKKGKNSAGKISIRFSYYDEKKVEILVSDDGAGADPSRIRDAALKCGVITQEDYDLMNDKEILPLVFQSGLTTSRIITDTSGRGLGLAIVLEKVNKIGGTITIDTAVDRGTSFRILLPSRLAAFKGLIVHESQQTFVFPLKNVERAMRINPESIHTVERQAVFELHSEQIPLVVLGDILGIPGTTVAEKSRMVCVVVVIYDEKRLGISVDDIGYVQDVMIKEFGEQLTRVQKYTSATVLGSGKVVPVLNISDLMKSAIRLGDRGTASVPAPDEEKVREKISVLVTEDSITSRMLLKNILESGGYSVETAVDGIDAFSKLRTRTFDLVVSDVDMPRMNGFVLTEKIRTDKKLSEIPVVLVTALDSQRDRERGIDVGADAYIVKASFDQSNLLEVVRKLIGR